jgi:putative hydrolase of the HAD superfamily
MTNKVIIWDFDGTLALHKGLWSGTMLAALDMSFDTHNVTIDSIKPYLQSGFPWHEPYKAHPELSTPSAWWSKMERYFENIYYDLGFDRNNSIMLARRTHDIYIDENRYSVFPGTINTLSNLKNLGWTNVILSNHVPELPDIVDKLGFSEVVEACFTSAAIGYEKPNTKSFQYVIDYFHYPDFCVMIGDSISADIKGANSAGIQAILLYTKTMEPIPY